jgi:hypothetical protein
MSNATEHRDSGTPGEADANPYAPRFQLPEHDVQLEGWVDQTEQPLTVEDLPTTTELRDLLEGRLRTPVEQPNRWVRPLILVIALTAALFWLYVVRRYLLDIIAFG